MRGGGGGAQQEQQEEEEEDDERTRSDSESDNAGDVTHTQLPSGIDLDLFSRLSSPPLPPAEGDRRQQGPRGGGAARGGSGGAHRDAGGAGGERRNRHAAESPDAGSTFDANKPLLRFFCQGLSNSLLSSFDKARDSSATSIS